MLFVLFVVHLFSSGSSGDYLSFCAFCVFCCFFFNIGYHGFNGFFVIVIICVSVTVIVIVFVFVSPCRPSRSSNLVPRLAVVGVVLLAILTDRSSLKQKYLDYDVVPADGFEPPQGPFRVRVVTS